MTIRVTFLVSISGDNQDTSDEFSCGGLLSDDSSSDTSSSDSEDDGGGGGGGSGGGSARHRDGGGRHHRDHGGPSQVTGSSKPFLSMVRNNNKCVTVMDITINHTFLRFYDAP